MSLRHPIAPAHHPRMRLPARLAGLVLLISLTTCGDPSGPSEGGIHKIEHVVMIMQENRSFDSYFGTFPGANGIPMQNGVPTVCVPDPRLGGCLHPYHDSADKNLGGPHGASNATRDIDGGRMDGFAAEAEHSMDTMCTPQEPECSLHGPTDVMGYHDQREIPNYWTYAKQFVLQDRMFEPNASWSLPAHLFMVSEWSARCSRTGDPMSCTNDLDNPQGFNGQAVAPRPNYAWTDLTYLLHKHNVSWKYYVAEGTEIGRASCRERV